MQEESCGEAVKNLLKFSEKRKWKKIRKLPAQRKLP